MHGLVALMPTVVLFQFGAALGAPGDIFSIPAPVIGSDPPKASDITDGDASVSTQTGALQYSYPIRVPPGRNGMVPHLALSYSSQAPIYGGIAAGWSLYRSRRSARIPRRSGCGRTLPRSRARKRTRRATIGS